MGETTETGTDEAEAAADRLEAALARIATHLSNPKATSGSEPTSQPAEMDHADASILAARLDRRIERVRAGLTATAGKTA